MIGIRELFFYPAYTLASLQRHFVDSCPEVTECNPALVGVVVVFCEALGESGHDLLQWVLLNHFPKNRRLFRRESVWIRLWNWLKRLT